MDYELRAQGASLEAYAQMLGGDLEGIKNSMRPNAVQTVRINVMLEAVAAAEGIEVSDEECEEEYTKLADAYRMDVEKVKEIMGVETMKGDLQVRKAAKLIGESAVAAAPKTEE